MALTCISFLKGLKCIFFYASTDNFDPKFKEEPIELDSKVTVHKREWVEKEREGITIYLSKN